MIHRYPTEEQTRWARKYLETNNMGQRGVFDGDYHQQLFGLIAQIIITDLLGIPRPNTGGFDGGNDLTLNNKTWDVKCAIRTVRPLKKYAVNLTESQTKYDCDGYIFMSYNSTDGTYTILGWSTKDDFLTKSTYRAIGDEIPRDDGSKLIVQGMPFRELLIRDLRPINNILELPLIGQDI